LIESSDEGISPDYDEQAMEDRKRQVIDLRCQLDRDQRLRMMMEDEVRKVDAQVYPTENIPPYIPHMNMQAQMQKDKMVIYFQILTTQTVNNGNISLIKIFCASLLHTNKFCALTKIILTHAMND